MKQVPVMRPKLAPPEAVLPYLHEIHESRVFSNQGPLVQRLGSTYAKLLRVAPEQVATACNATQALTGVVATADAREWVVPSWTFAATPLAVVAARRRLIWAKVDEESWMMDVAKLPTRRGPGLMPVVPFGNPFSLDPWRGFTEVIIDAAASLGSLPDLSDLPQGWAVVFSLHATKVLGAGEGAIAVFGDRIRAARFRSWTNFGFEGTRVPGMLGTNAKMSEIAAAYALAAVDCWSLEREEWTAARSQARDVIGRQGLSCGPIDLQAISPYWVIDCGSEARLKRLERKLAERGIESRRWWPVEFSGNPVFSAVASGVSHDSSLPRRVLGLPMFRDLAPADFSEIELALGASA